MMPSMSATGHGSGPDMPNGMPRVVNAQLIMPASMNSVGIVKLRKLRTPMVSVNATATVT